MYCKSVMRRSGGGPPLSVGRGKLVEENGQKLVDVARDRSRPVTTGHDSKALHDKLVE